jgi:lipopolysaccharide heptosyltransferase II
MFYHLKARLREIYVKTRRILLSPFFLLRKTMFLLQNDIKSILFLRHDRIGDMVQSTAALKALRKGYPRAKIAVLASKSNHEILMHNPNIDEILIYNGISRFIREIRPRRFDLVIDSFVTYELRQALMAYLSGGKYRIGFEEGGREVFSNVNGPTASSPKQMVDHLLDLAELAGGKRAGCEPEVFLSDTEITRATEAIAEKGISTDAVIIAIHPGAYYPSQRWPAERFGELSRRILEKGEVQVILIGSIHEEGLLEEIKKCGGADIKTFSCNNIRELIALLSRCKLLVCNNSGPMHIASALKVSTVSMIGPTVIPLWLPYGENNMVISKPLSCSPCNRAVCKVHECMESITVDEVFEAVETQIAHITPKRKKRTVNSREKN